jgi:hypothetical protein
MQIMKKMWSVSASGVAFNLISIYSEKRNPAAQYCDPVAVYKYCNQEYGYATILDHSYIRNDFLVGIKK